MLKVINGLPSDVLGIEATGKVTHEDYQEVLIPTAEALMAKGPLNMLYVVGPDFMGYEIEALWDDGAFGIKHWHQFKRIAVVTENTWLRSAVTMFSPFFPGHVQLFSLSELDTAKDWVSRKENADTP